MHIKSTRRSTDNYTLFNATEGNAMTLIRNHVRAIDNSDDELLKVYLDAAIDYMENMSDRLLGIHDVELLIDKDESKYLMSAPIDNVIDVDALYFRAKDPDETTPFAENYELISKAAKNTTEDYIFGDDDEWNEGRVLKVGASGSVNVVMSYHVDVIDTNLGDGNIDSVLFLVEQKQNDGSYVSARKKDGTNVASRLVEENSTVSHTLGQLGGGIYRVRAQAQNGEQSGAVRIGDVQYRYISISDGTDFQNLIDTLSYPIYIDIRKGLDVDEVSKKGSDYNKHFWKMKLEAGTALDTLPAQYKQAALLLIGHYYNMREAEVIGGISVEIKEGVRRLMASVRKY